MQRSETLSFENNNKKGKTMKMWRKFTLFFHSADAEWVWMEIFRLFSVETETVYEWWYIKWNKIKFRTEKDSVLLSFFTVFYDV